jgi:hypothetical protein
MVSPEHHGALVDHLVQSPHAVARIWPIRVRIAAILTLWVGLALALAWSSPRPDLAWRVGDVDFAVALAALAVASGYVTLLALRCAVPGRAPWWVELAVAAALVATAAVALAVGHGTARPVASGWSCALRTLVIAAGPWAVLVAAIRRGAPVRVVAAAIHSGAAATLLATTLMRVVCADDTGRHWLVWHLGAAALATVVSIPVATRWLRAWRRA